MPQPAAADPGSPSTSGARDDETPTPVAAPWDDDSFFYDAEPSRPSTSTAVASTPPRWNIVPEELRQSPADAVLTALRDEFPGVDDRVLTGVECALDWPDYGVGAHREATRHTGPGMATVVTGHPEGPEARVALMPTAGVGGPEVDARIGRKILQGEQLYQRVMRGEPPPPTKENAALLMWYLQALASRKAAASSGQPGGLAMFKEGALTIEDPGHKLETWLKSFNVYRRSSSHLDEYQRIPGCEPYGLDLRGVEMPNERRTVLLARLPGNREDRSLLFLKMEPHGCRGLSFQGTGRETGVRQSIKRFFANIRDYLGHAGGWRQSVRQRGGDAEITGQNNRERVDAQLRAPYEQTLSWIQGRGALRADDPEHPQDSERVMGNLVTTIATILDDPARAGQTGGIHTMLEKLDQAQAAWRDIMVAVAGTPDGEYVTLGNPPVGIILCTSEARARFHDLDRDLQSRLDATRAQLRSQGDHPELRFGREVILLQDEMAVGQVQPVRRLGHEPIEGAGRLSDQGQRLMEGAYRYIQADLVQQQVSYLSQFSLDAARTRYTVAGQVFNAAPAGPRGSEAGQAINRLVESAGDPQEVATFLKCLAHQGLMAPVSAALTGHAMMVTGMPIGPSTFPGAAFGMYEVRRVSPPPDSPGLHVYRLTGTYDSRLSGATGVRELSDGRRYDLEGSYVQAKASVLVTYNPETRQTSVALDGPPSFEYRLTPAGPEA